MSSPAGVQRHFQGASRTWGTRYERAARGMADLDLQLRREHVLRLLEPWLRRGEVATILDLGCGAGNVLAGLPRQRVRIVGVDLVPEMIRAAAARHPQDRYFVAEATDLPLPDASVDLVVCAGMLEYAPVPEAVLASIRRVLRPGGALIVSFPNRACLFRRLRHLERGLDGLLARLRYRGAGRASAPPAYAHRQWTPGAALALLHQAGFGPRQMLYSCYGFWGRLGRLGLNLRWSVWLTRRNPQGGPLSPVLAATLVVLATRSEPRLPSRAASGFSESGSSGSGIPDILNGPPGSGPPT